MLNFRLIRARIAKCLADHTYQSELENDKTARVILDKLRRGKFRTNSSEELFVDAPCKGDIRGVIALLEAEGLKADLQRSYGDYRNSDSTTWVIKLPNSDNP